MPSLLLSDVGAEAERTERSGASGGSETKSELRTAHRRRRVSLEKTRTVKPKPELLPLPVRAAGGRSADGRLVILAVHTGPASHVPGYNDLPDLTVRPVSLENVNPFAKDFRPVLGVVWFACAQVSMCKEACVNCFYLKSTLVFLRRCSLFPYLCSSLWFSSLL